MTKVLFIDSCFAGSLASKGVTSDRSFALPTLDLDELTGSVFLTASAAGESAYESEELGGGLFTHDVIAGLNGAADSNSDGFVTIDELYQYVYREGRLRSMTSQASGVTHPEFHADLHGHGALVLSTLKQNLGMVRVDSGIIGKIHLQSLNGLGTFAVYGSPDGATEFPLPEGSYRAVIRRSDEIGEASVLIARSETTDLRAGQFSWTTSDLAPQRVVKGGASIQATSLYTVGMRALLGDSNVPTVVLEGAHELTNVASSSSRLTLMGSLGVEQGSGSEEDHEYSERGISVGLAATIAMSNLAVRGVLGLGLTREWQDWKDDPWNGHGGSLTTNDPLVYVGLMLPLGATSSGFWSVSARREVAASHTMDGTLISNDQYLLGLALEP